MTDAQVLTVSQMQAAEQALIDAGSSVEALMQIAGEGAAEWVWRVAAGRSVTVLCGPGNNGGDGYVIAETLRQRGLEVVVVAPLSPKTDAAKSARRQYQGKCVSSGANAAGSVLVDCLFGSGLKRPLSPEHLLLLRDLADRHAVRIAIDVPSGIDSDTGATLNDRLPEYRLTLALGGWKYAHRLLPARKLMGEQKLVPIGVGAVPGAAQIIRLPNITAPAIDAHKYTRGLCAIVAGEMPGAPIIASQAAMRAGAGYVKLLATEAPLKEPPSLVVSGQDIGEALSDQRISSVLIGPGLGRGEAALERLQSTLRASVPTVLDADALMLLRPGMLQQDNVYLATPHDGELETLCRSFAIVASSRQDRARALAQTSGMTVIAKGPDTIVAAPDGRVGIAQPASSWLSVAGSGDVLAGIAASRLAAGRSPFEAAGEAVYLHGEAARRCGPAFTADELALAVSGAIAAAV